MKVLMIVRGSFIATNGQNMENLESSRVAKKFHGEGRFHGLHQDCTGLEFLYVWEGNERRYSSFSHTRSLAVGSQYCCSRDGAGMYDRQGFFIFYCTNCIIGETVYIKLPFPRLVMRENSYSLKAAQGWDLKLSVST